MALARTSALPRRPARSRRGTAMLEWLFVMIIILIPCGAMAVLLGRGLWMKEDVQTEARRRLWRQPRRGWWHHDRGWGLHGGRWQGGGDDRSCSWSDWDPDASDRPVGNGAGTAELPRGTGDEITYLYNEALYEPERAADDRMARDYYYVLFNNLPARHEVQTREHFDPESPAYQHLERDVVAEYAADSVTWVHQQLPAWMIAQFGPTAEINQAFREHLADLPPEAWRMRDEILSAWFEEEVLPNWNSIHAVHPTE